MTGADFALRGDGLGHQFAGRWLFRDVSFCVAAHEIMAIIGPSGSGKTTLLSIIGQLIDPSEGTIAVGTDHTWTSAWLFQVPSGVAARTAVDNVIWPAVFAGTARDVAQHEALVIMASLGVDVVAQSRFRDLSGGEAHRVVLSRALMSTRDVLLLDEPTAQLDRSTASTVVEAIASARQQSSAPIIVATHDPLVTSIADHIVSLE